MTNDVIYRFKRQTNKKWEYTPYLSNIWFKYPYIEAFVPATQDDTSTKWFTQLDLFDEQFQISN